MVRLLLLAATLQCASNYHLPAAAPPRRAVAAVAPSFARLAPLRMEAFSFDPFDRDVFRILMDAQSEARVLGARADGAWWCARVRTSTQPSWRTRSPAVGRGVGSFVQA